MYIQQFGASQEELKLLEEEESVNVCQVMHENWKMPWYNTEPKKKKKK